MKLGGISVVPRSWDVPWLTDPFSVTSPASRTRASPPSPPYPFGSMNCSLISRNLACQLKMLSGAVVEQILQKVPYHRETTRASVLLHDAPHDYLRFPNYCLCVCTGCLFTLVVVTS